LIILLFLTIANWKFSFSFPVASPSATIAAHSGRGVFLFFTYDFPSFSRYRPPRELHSGFLFWVKNETLCGFCFSCRWNDTNNKKKFLETWKKKKFFERFLFFSQISKLRMMEIRMGVEKVIKEIFKDKNFSHSIPKKEEAIKSIRAEIDKRVELIVQYTWSRASDLLSEIQ
jgi:hypothetical protein